MRTMSGITKTVIIGAGLILIASAYPIWRLWDSNTWQGVGTWVQVAIGVLTVALTALQRPERGTTRIEALGTGRARASGGGHANSGAQIPGGSPPTSARAENTGDATAEGGGNANSGVTGG